MDYKKYTLDEHQIRYLLRVGHEEGQSYAGVPHPSDTEAIVFADENFKSYLEYILNVELNTTSNKG